MVNQFLGGRRIVRAAVSAELMAEFMREGWTIPSKGTAAVTCEKGIPPDAKYAGMIAWPENHSAWLIFEHESFDVVPEGSVIPIVTITHRRIMFDE